MVTGTGQESCTTLFPLWSLRKIDIPTKNEKNEIYKTLRGILMFKQRKIKANQKGYLRYYAPTVSVYSLNVN